MQKQTPIPFFPVTHPCMHALSALTVHSKSKCTAGNFSPSQHLYCFGHITRDTENGNHITTKTNGTRFRIYCKLINIQKKKQIRQKTAYSSSYAIISFSALTLLVQHQQGQPSHKKTCATYFQRCSSATGRGRKQAETPNPSSP